MASATKQMDQAKDLEDESLKKRAPALDHPVAAERAPLLKLQRTIGNQAMQRLLAGSTPGATGHATSSAREEQVEQFKAHELSHVVQNGRSISSSPSVLRQGVSFELRQQVPAAEPAFDAVPYRLSQAELKPGHRRDD